MLVKVVNFLALRYLSRKVLYYNKLKKVIKFQ